MHIINISHLCLGESGFRRVLLTLNPLHMYKKETIYKHKLRQRGARHASCLCGNAINFLHLVGAHITAFQEILAGQISVKSTVQNIVITEGIINSYMRTEHIGSLVENIFDSKVLPRAQ